MASKKQGKSRDEKRKDSQEQLRAEQAAIREEQAASVEEEARIEYVEQKPAELVRIEIDVAINGLPAKQRLTVDKAHPFYSGLLEQNLAHVIAEDED